MPSLRQEEESVPYDDDITDTDVLDFDRQAEHIADAATTHQRWSAIASPRPAKHGRARKPKTTAVVNRAVAQQANAPAAIAVEITGPSSEVQQPVQPTASASAPGRRDTRFQKGNQHGRKHGLYATTTPQELLRRQREFEEAVLADEPETPSTLRRAQIANLALNQRLLWQVAAALEQRGVVDPFGKVRIAWLQRIDSLTSQCKSLSQLLGLKREARDVTPQSPADVVAQAERSSGQ
jgi:hypothetical protein